MKLAEADDYSLWASGTRIEGYVTRTTKGHAVSEFWGLKQNGFYESVADVIATKPFGQSDITEADAAAYVGRFRFEDLNGDGKLDDSDRTFIGSPHPDLTGGLNATLTWKTGTLLCSGTSLSAMTYIITQNILPISGLSTVINPHASEINHGH